MKQLYIYILSIIAVVSHIASCTPEYTPKEDLPIAYVNFTMESNNNFRRPAKITFINLSTVDSALGEPEFFWNFGDGNISVTSDDTIYHIYNNYGDYNVSLVLNTPKMEPDTITQILSVKPLYEYFFSESFESYTPNETTGDSLTNSWLVIHNDNGIPYDTILFDKAWKVIYSDKMRSNVVASTSYYRNSPVPDADNWLISPKIPLSETDSFTIQWKAMSLTQSGKWPDSYQVYISNTTQEIDSCKFLLKEVVDEWWATDATNIPGSGIHEHKVDISEFSGDTIYLGFRLMTPAPGGSRLAVDSILVTGYYDSIPITKKRN